MKEAEIFFPVSDQKMKQKDDIDFMLMNIFMMNITFRIDEFILMNVFLQEIPENGADFAHFFMLHEDNTLAGGDLRLTKSKLGRIMTHKWTPKNWHVGEESEKHMIKFQLFLDSFIGETSVKLPGFDSGKVDVCQVIIFSHEFLYRKILLLLALFYT